MISLLINHPFVNTAVSEHDMNIVLQIFAIVHHVCWPHKANEISSNVYDRKCGIKGWRKRWNYLIYSSIIAISTEMYVLVLNWMLLRSIAVIILLPVNVFRWRKIRKLNWTCRQKSVCFPPRQIRNRIYTAKQAKVNFKPRSHLRANNISGGARKIFGTLI